MLQLQVDFLGRELGPRDINTIEAFISLTFAVGASEEVARARALLVAYEATSSDKDMGWYSCLNALVVSLSTSRQYQEAEAVCRDCLGAIDFTHKQKASALSRLSDILQHMDDLVGAEGCARQSVAEAITDYGRQNSATVRFMLEHALILRMLGRDDEAEEVEVSI
jgi:hypothetical protein